MMDTVIGWGLIIAAACCLFGVLGHIAITEHRRPQIREADVREPGRHRA